MSSKASVRTPSKASGKAGRLPAAVAASPDQIRNVALVGHSGVGKTTLVEHLLAATGALSRAGSVTDGTTVSDSDPVEVAQQRSVFLSVCPLTYQDVVINLLDTPGFADFVPELRAGLRAADAALFVVSAADDLDQTTLALWEECAALGTPRAVVVNRLDVPRADLEHAVAACRQAFGGVDGNAVLPLYLPTGEGDQLVELLGSADPAHEADRAALIEAMIAESEDESLLDRYLGGEELDPETLSADLHTAVGRGHFHPVVPVCAATDQGLTELLDLIVRGFPTPQERTLPKAWTPVGGPGPELSCDPAGPLAAEVVRTWVDPYLGRLSLVRVFSGTIRTDTALHVSGHGGAERGHPDHDDDEKTATLLDAALTPIDRAMAGGLCVVARLASAETGDALSDQSQPLAILPWQLPEPQLPIAVRAATRNDEDGLAKALDPAGRGRPGSSDRAQRTTPASWCSGAWARRTRDVVLSRLRAGGARSRPSRSGSAAGHLHRARRAGMAGRSSSPAGTASTRSAMSRSSRCRVVRASSSSTGWSVARCRATSSARSRRARATSWRRASPPRSPPCRSSTSGSPCWTARRTAWTPPTLPSRSPAAWR